MHNPQVILPDNSTRDVQVALRGRVFQCVSDVKVSTQILPPFAPAYVSFFTTPPGGDQTVDRYDAARQLVTSGKLFVIQAIGVNITFIPTEANPVADDFDYIVQHGILVLYAQDKEIGAFRVRHLNSCGGTFIAGDQAILAASAGVLNGDPTTNAYRVAELKIETDETFKAVLFFPQTFPPYQFTTPAVVEVDLFGYELRPKA
jgi:hypothetical protein